jgi:hypothetical protein
MADDTLILTGPTFQQQKPNTILVTPTGGKQANLADLINGGTVAQSGTMSTLTVGTVTTTGFNINSITNNITASTTQTLAGAVAINTGIAVVTKVGTAGDAVKLPLVLATPGNEVWIFNQGASAMAIFPGETLTSIDAGTTAASVTLTNAKNAVFIQTSGTTWISAQGGAKSA